MNDFVSNFVTVQEVRRARVTAGQCPLHGQPLQQVATHWLMCNERDKSGFRCGVMVQTWEQDQQLAPGYWYLLD